MEHKARVADVFDRAAPCYGEKGCSFFDYAGRRLVEFAAPSAGNKILDIATGKGAVLLPAAERVGPRGTAIGIDLSSKMIEGAAKRIPFSWIALYQMDAESLSFPDNFFDVAFCAFSLFFFAHIAQALSECKRVLRSGGRLAVSTFGKKPVLDQWISERLQELRVTSKLTLISLNSALALQQRLADAGFTQIEIYEESKVFWHETAEEWWDSLWTRGVRYRLEQLSSQDLERLKREALLQAGSGRVGEERHILYSIAQCPKK